MVINKIIETLVFKEIEDDFVQKRKTNPPKNNKGKTIKAPS